MTVLELDYGGAYGRDISVYAMVATSRAIAFPAAAVAEAPHELSAKSKLRKGPRKFIARARADLFLTFRGPGPFVACARMRPRAA